MPRIVTKIKYLIGGAIPPLDDPTYAPVHQPINGRVPDVVARWGPNSQLRWFRRFRNQLAGRQDWEQFYCETDRHRGTCCTSCWDEYQDGYGVILDGWCCCRAIRERDKAA